MPALVRKLLIFAAVDGLVLQPLSVRGQQRPTAPVKIDYKSHTVSPLLRNVDDDDDASTPMLEAYGIIGLLTVSNFSYCIAISRRTQVAQIWGKPIYVVTGVAVIPLGSQAEARQAIQQAKKTSARQDRKESAKVTTESEDDDSDNDTVLSEERPSMDADDMASTPRSSMDAAEQPAVVEKREPGIVEDVITKKGGYGRFAERWFSRRGWNPDRTRTLETEDKKDVRSPDASSSSEQVSATPRESGETSEDQTEQESDTRTSWPETQAVEESSATAAESVQEHLTTSLLPKLVQTTRLLFNSKTFFFSYDLDISRNLASQRRSTSDVPMHKQFDQTYFWNQHLASPLVQGGFNELALPLMQGFVGQRSFTIGLDSASSKSPEHAVEGSTMPSEQSGNKTQVSEKPADAETKHEKSFLLTLISRRSVKRAGLRYLRRGIDENGNTANAVESEQILSSPDWDPAEKISSFLQFRGSMPLFFSQTPYTFKPVPVLFGTPETNQRAIKKHFTDLTDRYGRVQAVSLVDRHGNETKIGQAYEDNVKALNGNGGINANKVDFNWFEFHHVCRGMKFENVSVLVDELTPFLNSSGWITNAAGSVQGNQTGVIRTNCMDCLDRTNVCQSAFGQYVLECQLASLGHTIDLRNDPTTAWFNTLWADNGDAISRAYAGTAALKGDYTRTRKRNAMGALTDFTLTLSRYYRNLFEDFFAQAAIDYLLGTVTAAVFSEFEATMTTADPAMDLRKARESAITTAAHVIIEDDAEDLVHGWALAMPATANSLRTFPFEEALLLLTDRAVYAVRFDWTTDKVHSFERIELSRVRGLKWGTYVTETNAPAQMDVEKNVGFVLRYTAATLDGDGSPTVRVMTRSLENAMEAPSMEKDEAVGEGKEGKDSDTSTKVAEGNKGDAEDMRVLAFKALPSRSAIIVRTGKEEAMAMAERQTVCQICAEIVRVAGKYRTDSGKGGVGEAHEGLVVEVQEGDIISVEEAKRSTGYLERGLYSLKKLVWG